VFNKNGVTCGLGRRADRQNWNPMMTQAFPHPVAGQEPMTRRALAKQRTRQRLLAAAKRLVTERGYEAATVRDIASAADLSTGAVFASFSDKADLFNEVILADHAALAEQMDAAATEENSTRATLIKLLALAYAFHFEELPLVQAAIGFSWLRDAAVERRNREGVKMILAKLSDVLRAGVKSGELSPSLDVELIAEMVWDSYVANYRRAIFDGWDMQALRARVADQIEVLLDGYQIAA
jgi:AcrR family transcriptional regulator